MVHQKEVKGEYIQWRPEESNLLIELVANCCKEGLIDHNGRIFKTTVETNILAVLNEKFNSRKTYKHYVNRMKILKHQYRDFVNLLHFDSRFEWNQNTKKFTAPDQVWNAYLREFPNQGHMRYETYEEYENMKLIFGRNMAMRRFEGSLPQPCQVTKNEIVPKQEVELPNDDDDDDEGNESGEAETVNDALVTKNDIFVEILAVLRSIESKLKLLQERLMVDEKKKMDVWDAITEIPKLSNHVRYKALTMIQNLEMSVAFLTMSVEDRLGWIQCIVPNEVLSSKLHS